MDWRTTFIRRFLQQACHVRGAGLVPSPFRYMKVFGLQGQLLCFEAAWGSSTNSAVSGAPVISSIFPMNFGTLAAWGTTYLVSAVCQRGTQHRTDPGVLTRVSLYTVVFTARPTAGVILDTPGWAFMVFVGTFKLDIAFRSSRSSTTGRRSVVCRRAYIDVVFSPLWAALFF